jgi:hypothetical protein
MFVWFIIELSCYFDTVFVVVQLNYLELNYFLILYMYCLILAFNWLVSYFMLFLDEF